MGCEVPHLTHSERTIDTADLYKEVQGLGQGTEESMRACATFATESAAMIARDLDIKPIILRSFGQVNQILSELSLAHVQPNNYVSSGIPARECLQYGIRFRHTLEQIYSNLGFTPRTAQPRSEGAAEELSRRFRERSRKVVRYLRRQAVRFGGDCASDEQFAFFLWLRVPGATRSKGVYSLRLVCSSAYHHWEPWSLGSTQEIRPEANFAPATALYTGQPVIDNIPSGGRSVWRGTLAYPLVATSNLVVLQTNDSRAPRALDSLQVGAVSMNTNKQIRVTETTPVTERSVLAAQGWEYARQEELHALMDDLAGSIIGEF